MSLAKGMVRRRLRRNRFQIIAQMLEASRMGLTKTQIMYKASLSFTQVVHYLSFLLEINLLEKISINEKTIYKTTQKGIRFLKRYREIQELVSDCIKRATPSTKEDLCLKHKGSLSVL
jgi:predicted transcriptional regulator